MVDHHRMAVNDRAIFRRDHILDDDGYNYRSSHPNNPSLVSKTFGLTNFY